MAANRFTDPHEPSRSCRGEDCYSHGVDEQQPAGGLACGECGHVFVTPAALLADHAAAIGRLNARLPDGGELVVAETDPAKITICPHCSHDF